MPNNIDPRTTLRKFTLPLLRNFLARYDGPTDIDWDSVTRSNVDPVYDVIMRLAETPRNRLLRMLREIEALSDKEAALVLSEEVRLGRPALLAEFDALKTPADRAAWVHVHDPLAFEAAAHFAEAKRLARGRHWHVRNDLPKVTIELKPERKEELKRQLVQHFLDKEGRGGDCHIGEYTSSTDGCVFLFAELEDLPDEDWTLENGALVPRPGCATFPVVFAYAPKTGVLAMFSQADRDGRGRLQQIFAKVILDETIAPVEPTKPSHRLSHLLDRERSLAIDPRDPVENPRITRVRLVPIGRTKDKVELSVDPAGGRSLIFDRIDEYLNTQRLSPDRVMVKLLTFHLDFLPAAKRRAKSMQFDVTPSSHNLKSKDDQVRAIGERCIALWEVVDA